MAELADALDSGSSGFTAMEVQVLLSAPYLAPDKHGVYRVLFSFRGANGIFLIPAVPTVTGTCTGLSHFL